MTAKTWTLLTLLTLLTAYAAMAQKSFSYDNAWKKIDDLIAKNLPKSAMEEVNKVYEQAKKEKAQAQQVKALIYKSSLVQQVEENDWLKNTRAFEKETATANEPVQQILHSVCADLYWNYYQNKRWQIYDRSATVNFIKDDPETWSAEDFHRAINMHYQASLRHPQLLQQTKLDAYDPIIIKGNQRRLRPTLYDLLVHKAIDYYETEENDIAKPAYEFLLNDAATLAPLVTFVRYEYISKDTTSSLLAATRLYQDVLRFHQADINKDALVAADIERIQFAHNHSTNANKEQLYKEALEHIIDQYPDLDESAQAGYLLAAWWRDKGDAYDKATGTEIDKNALAIAADIAKRTADKFKTTEGGVNATNLLAWLNRPLLSLKTEKVNTIAEPFRVLVNYKNTDHVFFRLIPVDDTVEKLLTANEPYVQDGYWKKLVKLKTAKTWNQALPVLRDLREHGTEIKTDGLPSGKYILFASINNDFNTGENAMAAITFHVSNISYANNYNDYFILDRQTGKPLAGAKMQLWHTSYDYKTRRNITAKGGTYTADKNGHLAINETSKNQYRDAFKIEVTYKNDHLFADDKQSITSYYPGQQTETTVNEIEKARYFIFTDRSIYRPGQVVYFKAIGVVQDPKTGTSNLYLSSSPTTVQLINANGEIANSLQLKPNEYGSISGSFTLPGSGITGSFQLRIIVGIYSTTSFNVEEYKRPKFYVSFDNAKDEYHLNDSVQINGGAMAYAGNNIDGATVKYRVRRATRFLYPWLLWRSGKIWPPYSHEDMEIAHGETVTDANGKFTVSFTAIPDLSVDKKLDPAFDYIIDADITDLNGETRSASKTVSVGYKSLVINISAAGGERQIADSFKQISISSNNLAGENISTNVQINVYQLQAPNRLIRERYWEEPDTAVMSQDEYIKYFPHDVYKNEDDPKNWSKQKLWLADSFTTGKETSYSLKTKTAAGWYRIEVSGKDKDGNEVTAVQVVAVSDPSKNLLPSPAYNIAQAIKDNIEPGETARFMQGTSATDLFVVQQIIKQESDSTKHFEFQKLSSQISLPVFAATEADRGGYTVTRFFIRDNRFYSVQWLVNVPWTNKELKISFETFRDKLLPGQEEKWKVKISGYKGDAVAAEMLAGMYDASLDQFAPHRWNSLNIWDNNGLRNSFNAEDNFSVERSQDEVWQKEDYPSFDKRFDELLTVGNYNYRSRMGRVPGTMISEAVAPAPHPQYKKAFAAVEADSAVADELTLSKNVKDVYMQQGEMFVHASPQKKPDNSGIQIRKNFNETAFFFPDLHTNDKGDIEFSFTMPEALTQWKLQTLAHTKDLRTAMATKTIVTQKQLMVQPNAPRFFRQGDSLILVSKIVNLTANNLQGTAQLQLLNAATLEPVDAIFHNTSAQQRFSINAGQSISVSFPVSIPLTYTDALTYRIIAKAGDVSDGEEMALPVLSNRMLVTESFPINMRGNANKTFTWEKLLKSGNDRTLQNQSLSVEYTSNPVWYAVQSLPYLMEYPYDCAEQTWNRFYANALATKITGSLPKIKAVFEQWKNVDTTALLSNLEKNQELKALLLEETPWVLQAKSESAQKKNMALLFDMVRMSNEADKAIGKLKEMQSINGGFVWFKGGPDDRYITQYIVASIGHLKKLDAWPAAQTNALNQITATALTYLDGRIKEDYDYLIQHKIDLKKNNLSSYAIQYLYARSFFTTAVPVSSQTAYNYYTAQAKQFWAVQNKYAQGMIALALQRMHDASTPKKILASLTENSISSEEFGMYWKEFNTGGYYWWQAPVESQALLIEAYNEIENNQSRVDDLKTWLLKQKQTQNWRSTKATADACYALLLQGSNWTNAASTVNIKLGNMSITPSQTEAGTGYFKETIGGEQVNPAMGNINIKISSPPQSTNQPVNKSTSWGSLYWQYFQDMDKITDANTSFNLKKQLFIQRNSDRGPVITPVNDNDVLKVGDRVKVRIELRTDRKLEYVHLKDMRAACFEPVNVLSQYKYKDGLGYYESTRDASTNFFISYLNKGTYVFEYDLFVTHTGNFSNGISSIQCMYAPEFSAHSEGIRVTVK